MLGSVIFVLVNTTKKTNEEEIRYSQFKQYIRAGKIKEVLISRNLIKGKFEDDKILKRFKTIPLKDYNLISDLEKNNVQMFSSVVDNGLLMEIFMNWGPTILFVLLLIWIMRGVSSGGKKAISFGKSRAKIISDKNSEEKISFKDVAGCDEAKEELQEIIDFLKNPGKFKKLGGEIPSGVLLCGEPGTGKTLLARAVAGEANVPFFSSSGSEFVEMFVGVGASRVRDLFEKGKKFSPCILFIDEIDAVGRHRFAGVGGGHDEREQTLNQLLVEMDGFDTNSNVILIAATNRPDVLDPALLRPGRFDRHVIIGKPNLKEREEILVLHSKKIKLNPKVDLKIIARSTYGFVGADLANIINESAILAARKNQEFVDIDNIEEAIDKIIIGPKRKSQVLSYEEKKLTAYHEAGHAIVAKFLPNTDPVYKVSIIPRSYALGFTLQLPERDKYSMSKIDCFNMIIILLAGRVAEKLVFSQITTGSSSDISEATRIATDMVTAYGMSDKIGPVMITEPDEKIFLGKGIAKDLNYSNKILEIIDEEIKNIINKAEEKALNIINDNIIVLNNIVIKLIEKEELTGKELNSIIKKGNIPVKSYKTLLKKQKNKKY
jgi:cell division protease FtsH